MTSIVVENDGSLESVFVTFYGPEARAIRQAAPEGQEPQVFVRQTTMKAIGL